MGLDRRGWVKDDEFTYRYITTNYSQVKVSLRGKNESPQIETDGSWYMTKSCLDELIGALTHVREEVYGK